MNETEELKPCPFCGQSPDVSMGGSIVSITCPRCNYEFDWARHGGFDWRGEWNARPLEDALRIELDKADGAGQELMAENEALRTKLVSVIAGFEYTLEMNKKLSDDLATALRRIPVDDDHLPPRGVRVRVWINGTESIARYSWVVPQWETIDGLYYHGDSLNHVTHWQPIPEYPEDGEG